MYRESSGEEAIISLDDIDIFRQSLEPLVKADKMGALLAQFPPSFKNDGFGQGILEIIAKHFGQYRLAVELRHKSWSDDPQIAGILRAHSIAWVQIDEPKFSTSIATALPATADFAYFRFHGRNAEMWWKGTTETRYQYLYSPDEISELAEKVKAASQKTSLTLAFFNNHWKAYAPRNAGDMIKALQMPFADFPAPNTGLFQFGQ